jgi:hypothetical protein
MNGPLVWIGFNVFILLALLFDMVVLRREAHTVTMREALLSSAAWCSPPLWRTSRATRRRFSS